MIFQSPEQHSLAQFNKLKELVTNPQTLNRQTTMWLAVQLVQHGWPNADTFINEIIRQLDSQDAKNFLNKLLDQTYITKEINDWEQFFNNQELLAKFYQLNGYMYKRGSFQKDKLVILFTTMFNNFYLSNAIMAKLLESLGVSILILKDATRFNYLRGVAGLGANLSEVADSINKIVIQENIKQSYIVGFSSGGYGSLFMSTKIPCQAYLGFSIHSSLSKNSALPKGKFLTSEVLDQVPPSELLDIKKLINAEELQPKRILVFGEDSQNDKAHSLHLDGTPNLILKPLAECGHISVGKCIENKTFKPMLEELISFEGL